MVLAGAAAVASITISVVSLQLSLSNTCVTNTVIYTTTVTATVTPQIGSAAGVRITESKGVCGMETRPSLELVEKIYRDGEGGYFVLVYREDAPNPCYRHYVAQALVKESYPPRLVITLRLEPISSICISCTGLIETRLLVGPYPPGTEIIVNRLSVVV